MSNKTKVEHYSSLKMALRLITLAIAIWALVVAYQAKSLAGWVDTKQEHVIEKLIVK
jgi:hypothetical protein